MRRSVLSGFVLLVWLLAGTTPTAHAFQWVDGFEPGMEVARERGVPAFVYFDAYWCSWCHQYERETLSRPEVQRFLDREFVPVKVDYDSRPDLVQRFGGRGLPFTVVLSPQGELLTRFVGVLQPEDLVEVLQRLPRPGEAQPPLARVERVDAEGLEAVREAWLDHLESLYDPFLQTLAGRFETGVTLKRPSPRAWIWLRDVEGWDEREREAAHTEAERLLDPVDGGFFNYFDPHRAEGAYRETSKLLEANAWISLWLTLHARESEAVADAARAGYLFLRARLWDEDAGGFWQAQTADHEYYALSPAERLRADPPPVERAKRTDANAQAAYALACAAQVVPWQSGPAAGAQLLEMAEQTLEFLLSEMVDDEGRVYHYWRDGERVTPELPEAKFWLLAAGAALEAVAPNEARQARLAPVAERAAAWLGARAQADEPLAPEVAAIVAWGAGLHEVYPVLDGADQEWALRQVRIEVESEPDEVVAGIAALERAVDGAGRGLCW
ncbi:thioredoxin family protein [Ectothiorhodospiraceae bacterium 2226]|nr:thioredoxin family protein [Ectothiorhodospiraceae bacterium 2226]